MKEASPKIAPEALRDLARMLALEAPRSRRRPTPTIPLPLEQKSVIQYLRSRGRAYGLDENDFNYLWKLQHGECILCKRKLNPGFVVHHSHKTGEVIGLAHQRCNALEGRGDLTCAIHGPRRPYPYRRDEPMGANMLDVVRRGR